MNRVSNELIRKGRLWPAQSLHLRESYKHTKQQMTRVEG